MDLWFLGQSLGQLSHCLGHQGAWSRTAGEDDVRQPDLPLVASQRYRRAQLIGQLKIRQLANNRQLTGVMVGMGFHGFSFACDEASHDQPYSYSYFSRYAAMVVLVHSVAGGWHGLRATGNRQKRAPSIAFADIFLIITVTYCVSCQRCRLTL